MKKGLGLLLGVAFIMALGFTSCKKDYTCECTFTAPTPMITLPYEKTTKADAEEACDAAEVTYKVADAGASCSLK